MNLACSPSSKVSRRRSRQPICGNTAWTSVRAGCYRGPSPPSNLSLSSGKTNRNTVPLRSYSSGVGRSGGKELLTLMGRCGSNLNARETGAMRATLKLLSIAYFCLFTGVLIEYPEPDLIVRHNPHRRGMIALTGSILRAWPAPERLSLGSFTSPCCCFSKASSGRILEKVQRQNANFLWNNR